MGAWDEMPEGFQEVVYGNSGRGSMHRTLVLNLAFNTWDGGMLEGVGRGEFGDDLVRYLTDALRADGVGRRWVREVLSGMPREVYWEREGEEREGEDEEERDGDGGVKVEGMLMLRTTLVSRTTLVFRATPRLKTTLTVATRLRVLLRTTSWLRLSLRLRRMLRLSMSLSLRPRPSSTRADTRIFSTD